jgi:hypothetical protein
MDHLSRRPFRQRQVSSSSSSSGLFPFSTARGATLVLIRAILLLVSMETTTGLLVLVDPPTMLSLSMGRLRILHAATYCGDGSFIVSKITTRRTRTARRMTTITGTRNNHHHHRLYLASKKNANDCDDVEYDENGETTLQPAKHPAIGTPLVMLLLLLVVGSSCTIGVIICAMSLHATAWFQFFKSVLEMKTHASSPQEFTSAMIFWFVAAILHPILQPIFGISELLHGTPWLFGSGFVVTLYLLVRYTTVLTLTTTSLAALFGLIAYMGAGLDGTLLGAGGDYDIALDDQVVKGCPTYEQVQSERMKHMPTTFDLNMYQGKWYWHKVHDWTQFKELYDTTLDIELLWEDEEMLDDPIRRRPTGYINKLSLKGPSPVTSPYSWDKSPLANGVHYYWKGSSALEAIQDTVVGTDRTTTTSGLPDNQPDQLPKRKTRSRRQLPPGSFIETGFGVQFPNYIVDTSIVRVPRTTMTNRISSSGGGGDPRSTTENDKNDDNATENDDSYTTIYDELIQFQCIEVGGVRLYEGIDFMTRSPTISDAQLDTMHQRAKAAGLYPYGASPEQMHRILQQQPQRRSVEIDNAWQSLWRTLGVKEALDRLAELELSSSP